MATNKSSRKKRKKARGKGQARASKHTNDNEPPSTTADGDASPASADEPDSKPKSAKRAAAKKPGKAKKATKAKAKATKTKKNGKAKASGKKEAKPKSKSSSRKKTSKKKEAAAGTTVPPEAGADEASVAVEALEVTDLAEHAHEPETIDEPRAPAVDNQEEAADADVTGDAVGTVVELIDDEEDVDIDAVLASIEELSDAPNPEASGPTPNASDDPQAPDDGKAGASSAAGASTPDESVELDPETPEAATEAESVEDPEADETPAELSKPEERDRLIAQALAHAETQDARYRQPIPGADRLGRWKGLLASVVFVIAGYVAAAPPSWILTEAAAPISETDRLRGVRTTLLLQADEIETFRALNQRLPEALTELSSPLPGIRFVRSGPRSYQLFAFTVTGERVVYDPASPDPEFDAVRADLASVLEGS